MPRLRISDAPLLNSVIGDEKIPTGKYGDYTITPDMLVVYAQGKLPFATKTELAQVKAQLEASINTVQTTLSAEISTLSTKVDSMESQVLGVSQDLTLHKSDVSNPHKVTKAQVGLGNVDNTSDLNKPISTATQAAIDAVKNDKKKAIDILDEIGLTQQEWNNGVESIADLLAIPNPKSGSRVYVKSYYAGAMGTATPYSGGGHYVYNSALSAKNDGGSVLNGWVLQGEANIHNFGLTRYDGTDFSSIDDYNLSNAKYISSTTYNNYLAYCLSKKLPMHIPAGDYVLQDGNYTAPIYGMLGEERDVTRIFTAVSQTGVIFKYNNDEVYAVGHARILSNISIYTHRNNTACSVLEINTPTRGANVENATIYSSGEHLNYKKVWYLKHSNCGYFGYFRPAATLSVDPYTATAIVLKIDGENNNTHYDKCDFRDVKSVVRGRKAGFTTSGIGILWTICVFERIGECAFEVMYQNNTFDTCHFEDIGKHYGFITPANDLQRTILFYGGENTVTFAGTGNIWLGGTAPDSATFSIFNSEGRCFVHLGEYRMTKNSRPNIRLSGTVFGIRYCTVKSSMVINTEAANTNQVATHFTNDGSTLRQYAHEVSTQLDDVEKAKTSMKSIQREVAGLINGSAANRSCGTVTVRLYDKSVIVRSKGRIYRFGGTAPKSAQFFDFDATWLITPDTPANALVLSLTTSAVSGTKVDGTTNLDQYTSLFGTLLAADLKNGFSFPRKTNENTGAVSPFDVTYSINFSGIYSGYWATTGGYYSVIDVENEIVFTEDATKAKPNNAYLNPCINRST